MSPLNVAYFSNQFADAAGHGLARYSREMFAAIQPDPRVALTPVAAWSSLSPAALAERQRETGLHILKTGRIATSGLWHYANFPPVEWLMPGPVDVVHAASLGYAIATRKPDIVTVHDLGPLTHPQFFTNTKPWIMERALRQAEARAAAIVCVSNSTAQEVEDYLGAAIVPRLRVIGEGVSPEFFEDPGAAVLAGLDLPEVPFFLSAGKISPRKNVQGVIEALAQIAADVPHHLVLVGGAGWETEAVLSRIGGLEGRVHLLDYVSDAQLRALYHRAFAYLHPSLYEGFGLTVLEAMAAGCPVITANSSSLPEVAGDAALLVDPETTEEIASAMRALCDDAGYAARKGAEGLARARGFTWEAPARELADLLVEVGR